jgi:magnesium chelatase family protein
VTPVPFKELTSLRSGERSDAVRERVVRARSIQAKRFEGMAGVYSNSQMGSKLLHAVCELNEDCRTLLKTAMERLGLSARAYDRILKVSRTIADLDACENIRTEHLAEAIQYRSLDRENWAEKVF